jgi:hypothetical protein
MPCGIQRAPKGSKVMEFEHIRIRGLSPTVAIQQESASVNPR